MSTELATRQPGIQIQTMDELARVADMFAKSGMFTDARDAAQAGVRILAGQAWGIDPFTSMTAVQMIQNRPTMSAGVMAAKVKGHPKYDYVVRRLDSEACEIEFFQGDRSLGVSSFTIEDAKQAGYASKQNYRQTPRNMLFARALSNGVRWYTPDVFSASVYTPEDFMGESETPELYVEVTPAEKPVKPAAPALEAPAPEPEPEAAQEAPEPADDGPPLATPAQLRKLAVNIKEQGLTRDQAIGFFTWLNGRDISSSKELTKAEVSRVLDWDADQWTDALADYAVVLDGGPPEVDA